MPGTVVIDSCVFVKLFLDEKDRTDVIAFLRHARESGLALIAPGLFLYETLAVAAGSVFGARACHQLIREFVKAGFQLVEPDDDVVEQAITIANHGNPKSGFPTFYDSAYHALAMTRGGMFLTSDARHVAKAAALGSVVLLKDWKSGLSA